MSNFALTIVLLNGIISADSDELFAGFAVFWGGSDSMRISYKPLWRILLDRDITKKELREISGISTSTLAKLGKGENITTDVLLKICEALDCNINEIIETIPDEKAKRQPHNE